VKELLKLVHIWQSYRKNKSGTFFNGPRCMCIVNKLMHIKEIKKPSDFCFASVDLPGLAALRCSDFFLPDAVISVLSTVDVLDDS